MASFKAGCIWGLLILLTACGSPAPEKMQTPMRVDITTTFRKNTNPFRNPIMALQPYFSLTYATLFSLDRNIAPQPLLVERIEQKNSKEAILHLHRTFRFSDGSPIDAHQVYWSLHHAFRFSRTPNPLFRRLQGGEDFLAEKAENITGIEVLDEYSLRLSFKEANYDYPYYLASRSLAIVPKNWTPESLVTSAAFMPIEINDSDKFTLIKLGKNPGFPLPHGMNEEIEFTFHKQTDFFEDRISRGDGDLFLLPLVSGKYKSHPDLTWHKSPILGAFYLQLNPQKGALRDARLRRFLLHLFDFPKLLRQRNWDFASPATHILSYGIPEYFLFKPFQRSSPANPRPSGPIRIHALSLKSDIRPELFEFISHRLLQEDIVLDVEWLENSQELFDRLDQGDFELTAFYHMPDVPIAIHFYEIVFQPGLELNPGFEFPEAKKLLEEYYLSEEERQRLHILAQLEELSRKEAILVPVFNHLSFRGYRRCAANMEMNYLLQFLYPEKHDN